MPKSRDTTASDCMIGLGNGGDDVVTDWHRMITSIDVNRFGIASVWLKEQGLLLFVPTVSVGDYHVVCYKDLFQKLQARGFWWVKTSERN